MNKLLFTTALFLSNAGFGQFYDSDAVFHVELQYGSYLPNGYSYSTPSTDTVVAGQIANQLQWKGQYYYNNGPSQGGLTKTDTIEFEPMITLTSNDSVYIYREGAFHLAFKTNANIGEIWDLGPFSTYAGDPNIQDNHAYLKVTDVSINNYNGVSLRDIATVPCDSYGTELDFFQTDSADLYVHYYGVINERFGPLNNLRHLGFAMSTSEVNEVYPVSTLCYTGNSTGFVDFTPDVNCENDFQFVGLEDKDVSTFSVYPNPSTGVFHVRGDGSATITKYQIFDLQGRLIKEVQMNSSTKTMTIEMHQPGYYQLLLHTENKSVHSIQLSNL